MGEMILNVIHKQAYKSEAEWFSSNPIVPKGTFAISSDTNMYKVGNGSSHWSDLTYASANITKQDVVDALGYTPGVATEDLSQLLRTFALVIYPIGSIYMSANPTNPSELFGGTWESWGKGLVPVGIDPSDPDFANAEVPVGEKAHTLTIEEMPSHTHTTANHSHGMNHTHTVKHSHSMSHTHNVPDHRHKTDHDHGTKTTSEHPGHIHGLKPKYNHNQVSSGGTLLHWINSGTTLGNWPDAVQSGGRHTHSVTINGFAGYSGYSGELTTKSISTLATNEFIGSTSSISATVTELGKSIIDNSGDGLSHSNLQPSIPCYMWKRTA